MAKFSKGEAIKFGWNVMKANFGFFVKVVLVVFVISFGPQIVGSMLKGKEVPAGISLLSALVGIIFWVLLFIVNFGLIRISLKFADGVTPEFSELFSTKNIVRYVGAGILCFLIVIGGLLLFIIPGIIWGIKYQFYGFLVAQGNVTARESIRESGRITEGSKMDLFVFGLLIGLINLAGILALGIGLIATIPATMVATAYVFRKLQQSANTSMSPENAISGQVVVPPQI